MPVYWSDDQVWMPTTAVAALLLVLVIVWAAGPAAGRGIQVDGHRVVLYPTASDAVSVCDGPGGPCLTVGEIRQSLHGRTTNASDE